MSEASTADRRPRRLPWPRRGELTRTVDRLEAALVLAAVAVAALLLPVALALGSETYANQARAGEEQSRTRHETTATLTEDAPPVAVGTHGEVITTTSPVPARWTLPDGSERTGKVKANNGSLAGTVVAVWLDESGTPVERPVTLDQAAISGATVALGGWAAAAGLLALLCQGGRLAMNRWRSLAWQREWERVEPQWARTLS